MKWVNVRGPTVSPRPRLVRKTFGRICETLVGSRRSSAKRVLSPRFRNIHTLMDTVTWQQTSRGRRSTPVICITNRVPQSEPVWRAGTDSGCTAIPFGWFEEASCYHSSTEANQRTRVHAVSPSSPVSRTPGMRSDQPRSDALPRYHGFPPRSPSRGGRWSGIGSTLCYVHYYYYYYYYFFFMPLHAGHQVGPEAIKIKTVPRYFGAIRTPPRSRFR